GGCQQLCRRDTPDPLEQWQRHHPLPATDSYQRADERGCAGLACPLPGGNGAGHCRAGPDYRAPAAGQQSTAHRYRLTSGTSTMKPALPLTIKPSLLKMGGLLLASVTLTGLGLWILTLDSQEIANAGRSVDPQLIQVIAAFGVLIFGATTLAVPV